MPPRERFRRRAKPDEDLVTGVASPASPSPTQRWTDRSQRWFGWLSQLAKLPSRDAHRATRSILRTRSCCRRLPRRPG